MASRLNIGDIEDGQCGGDSRRGGDRMCRSRPPGLGYVSAGGCAVSLLCRTVGGVEVSGQDSAPIVGSGRGQDPARHRTNSATAPTAAVLWS